MIALNEGAFDLSRDGLARLEAQPQTPIVHALIDEVRRERGRADAFATNRSHAGMSYGQCREKSRTGLTRRGLQPNDLQVKWRGVAIHHGTPKDAQEVSEAIVDALVEQGPIAAWVGHGVLCVEQMIRAQADRANRAEAILRQRAANKEDGAIIIESTISLLGGVRDEIMHLGRLSDDAVKRLNDRIQQVEQFAHTTEDGS